MNMRKQFSSGLTVIGLALNLTTVQANAGPVLKGTFELPAASYLGNRVLQPGLYAIWVRTEGRDPVVHLSGEGVNTTFVSIARPEKNSGHNYLDIANVDGAYIIRSFDAGSISKSFTFGVTKNVKNKTLRTSVEPAMVVPVTSGASF